MGLCGCKQQTLCFVVSSNRGRVGDKGQDQHGAQGWVAVPGSTSCSKVLILFPGVGQPRSTWLPVLPRMNPLAETDSGPLGLRGWKPL